MALNKITLISFALTVATSFSLGGLWYCCLHKNSLKDGANSFFSGLFQLALGLISIALILIGVTVLLGASYAIIIYILLH